MKQKSPKLVKLQTIHAIVQPTRSTWDLECSLGQKQLQWYHPDAQTARANYFKYTPQHSWVWRFAPENMTSQKETREPICVCLFGRSHLLWETCQKLLSTYLSPSKKKEKQIQPANVFMFKMSKKTQGASSSRVDFKHVTRVSCKIHIHDQCSVIPICWLIMATDLKDIFSGPSCSTVIVHSAVLQKIILNINNIPQHPNV